MSEVFDDAVRLGVIRAGISEAALYEQLAEECVELAQAALKKARKIRDENYTPKNIAEIDFSLEEEYTDVVLVSDALELYSNERIRETKAKRWISRLYKRSDDD